MKRFQVRKPDSLDPHPSWVTAESEDAVRNDDRWQKRFGEGMEIVEIRDFEHANELAKALSKEKTDAVAR